MKIGIIIAHVGHLRSEMAISLVREYYLLRTLEPWTILLMPTNYYGVAEAYTVAFRKATEAGCDLVVTWEPDIIPLSPGNLRELIHAHLIHPNYSILSAIF